MSNGTIKNNRKEMLKKISSNIIRKTERNISNTIRKNAFFGMVERLKRNGTSPKNLTDLIIGPVLGIGLLPGTPKARLEKAFDNFGNVSPYFLELTKTMYPYFFDDNVPSNEIIVDDFKDLLMMDNIVYEPAINPTIVTPPKKEEGILTTIPTKETPTPPLKEERSEGGDSSFIPLKEERSEGGDSSFIPLKEEGGEGGDSSFIPLKEEGGEGGDSSFIPLKEEGGEGGDSSFIPLKEEGGEGGDSSFIPLKEEGGEGGDSSSFEPKDEGSVGESPNTIDGAVLNLVTSVSKMLSALSSEGIDSSSDVYRVNQDAVSDFFEIIKGYSDEIEDETAVIDIIDSINLIYNDKVDKFYKKSEKNVFEKINNDNVAKESLKLFLERYEFENLPEETASFITESLIVILNNLSDQINDIDKFEFEEIKETLIIPMESVEQEREDELQPKNIEELNQKFEEVYSEYETEIVSNIIEYCKYQTNNFTSGLTSLFSNMKNLLSDFNDRSLSFVSNKFPASKDLCKKLYNIINDDIKYVSSILISTSGRKNDAIKKLSELQASIGNWPTSTSKYIDHMYDQLSNQSLEAGNLFLEILEVYTFAFQAFSRDTSNEEIEDIYNKDFSQNISNEGIKVFSGVEKNPKILSFAKDAVSGLNAKFTAASSKLVLSTDIETALTSIDKNWRFSVKYDTLRDKKTKSSFTQDEMDISLADIKRYITQLPNNFSSEEVNDATEYLKSICNYEEIRFLLSLPRPKILSFDYEQLAIVCFVTLFLYASSFAYHELESDKEPLSEEPLSEEPLSEEPLSEEPLSEEPLSEEPLSEEPLSEEPLSEEPLSEEPLSEEPAAVDFSINEELFRQNFANNSFDYLISLYKNITDEIAESDNNYGFKDGKSTEYLGEYDDDELKYSNITIDRTFGLKDKVSESNKETKDLIEESVKKFREFIGKLELGKNRSPFSKFLNDIKTLIKAQKVEEKITGKDTLPEAKDLALQEVLDMNIDFGQKYCDNISEQINAIESKDSDLEKQNEVNRIKKLVSDNINAKAFVAFILIGLGHQEIRVNVEGQDFSFSLASDFADFLVDKVKLSDIEKSKEGFFKLSKLKIDEFKAKLDSVKISDLNATLNDYGQEIIKEIINIIGKKLQIDKTIENLARSKEKYIPTYQKIVSEFLMLRPDPKNEFIFYSEYSEEGKKTFRKEMYEYLVKECERRRIQVLTSNSFLNSKFNFVEDSYFRTNEFIEKVKAEKEKIDKQESDEVFAYVFSDEKDTNLDSNPQTNYKDSEGYFNSLRDEGKLLSFFDANKFFKLIADHQLSQYNRDKNKNIMPVTIASLLESGLTYPKNVNVKTLSYFISKKIDSLFPITYNQSGGEVFSLDKISTYPRSPQFDRYSIKHKDQDDLKSQIISYGQKKSEHDKIVAENLKKGEAHSTTVAIMNTLNSDIEGVYSSFVSAMKDKDETRDPVDLINAFVRKCRIEIEKAEKSMKDSNKEITFNKDKFISKVNSFADKIRSGGFKNGLPPKWSISRTDVFSDLIDSATNETANAFYKEYSIEQLSNTKESVEENLKAIKDILSGKKKGSAGKIIDDMFRVGDISDSDRKNAKKLADKYFKSKDTSEKEKILKMFDNLKDVFPIIYTADISKRKNTLIPSGLSSYVLEMLEQKGADVRRVKNISSDEKYDLDITGTGVDGYRYIELYNEATGSSENLSKEDILKIDGSIILNQENSYSIANQTDLYTEDEMDFMTEAIGNFTSNVITFNSKKLYISADIPVNNFKQISDEEYMLFASLSESDMEQMTNPEMPSEDVNPAVFIPKSQLDKLTDFNFNEFYERFGKVEESEEESVEVSDEESSDEESSDEVSSDEGSSDEGSSDEVSSDEVSSDEGSSDEVSSDEVSSDEVSSDEGSSDEVEDLIVYENTDEAKFQSILIKYLNDNKCFDKESSKSITIISNALLSSEIPKNDKARVRKLFFDTSDDSESLLRKMINLGSISLIKKGAMYTTNAIFITKKPEGSKEDENKEDVSAKKSASLGEIKNAIDQFFSVKYNPADDGDITFQALAEDLNKSYGNLITNIKSMVSDEAVYDENDVDAMLKEIADDFLIDDSYEGVSDKERELVNEAVNMILKNMKSIILEKKNEEINTSWILGSDDSGADKENILNTEDIFTQDAKPLSKVSNFILNFYGSLYMKANKGEITFEDVAAELSSENKYLDFKIDITTMGNKEEPYVQNDVDEMLKDVVERLLIGDKKEEISVPTKKLINDNLRRMEKDVKDILLNILDRRAKLKEESSSNNPEKDTSKKDRNLVVDNGLSDKKTKYNNIVNSLGSISNRGLAGVCREIEDILKFNKRAYNLVIEEVYGRLSSLRNSKGIKNVTLKLARRNDPYTITEESLSEVKGLKSILLTADGLRKKINLSGGQDLSKYLLIFDNYGAEKKTENRYKSRSLGLLREVLSNEYYDRSEDSMMVSFLATPIDKEYILDTISTLKVSFADDSLYEESLFFKDKEFAYTDSEDYKETLTPILKEDFFNRISYLELFVKKEISYDKIKSEILEYCKDITKNLNKLSSFISKACFLSEDNVVNIFNDLDVILEEFLNSNDYPTKSRASYVKGLIVRAIGYNISKKSLENISKQEVELSEPEANFVNDFTNVIKQQSKSMALMLREKSFEFMIPSSTDQEKINKAVTSIYGGIKNGNKVILRGADEILSFKLKELMDNNKSYSESIVSNGIKHIIENRLLDGIFQDVLSGILPSSYMKTGRSNALKTAFEDSLENSLTVYSVQEEPKSLSVGIHELFSISDAYHYLINDLIMKQSKNFFSNTIFIIEKNGLIMASDLIEIIEKEINIDKITEEIMSLKEIPKNVISKITRYDNILGTKEQDVGYIISTWSRFSNKIETILTAIDNYYIGKDESYKRIRLNRKSHAFILKSEMLEKLKRSLSKVTDPDVIYLIENKIKDIEMQLELGDSANYADTLSQYRNKIKSGKNLTESESIDYQKLAYLYVCSKTDSESSYFTLSDFNEKAVSSYYDDLMNQLFKDKMSLVTQRNDENARNKELKEGFDIYSFYKDIKRAFVIDEATSNDSYDKSDIPSSLSFLIAGNYIYRFNLPIKEIESEDGVKTRRTPTPFEFQSYIKSLLSQKVDKGTYYDYLKKVMKSRDVSFAEDETYKFIKSIVNMAGGRVDQTISEKINRDIADTKTLSYAIQNIKTNYGNSSTAILYMDSIIAKENSRTKNVNLTIKDIEKYKDISINKIIASYKGDAEVKFSINNRGRISVLRSDLEMALKSEDVKLEDVTFRIYAEHAEDNDFNIGIYKRQGSNSLTASSLDGLSVIDITKEFFDINSEDYLIDIAEVLSNGTNEDFFNLKINTPILRLISHSEGGEAKEISDAGIYDFKNNYIFEIEDGVISKVYFIPPKGSSLSNIEATLCRFEESDEDIALFEDMISRLITAEDASGINNITNIETYGRLYLEKYEGISSAKVTQMLNALSLRDKDNLSKEIFSKYLNAIRGASNNLKFKTVSQIENASFAVLRSTNKDHKYIMLKKDLDQNIFEFELVKDDKDGQRVRGKEYYGIKIFGDYYHHCCITSSGPIDTKYNDEIDIIVVDEEKDAINQYLAYQNSEAKHIQGIDIKIDSSSVFETPDGLSNLYSLLINSRNSDNSGNKKESKNIMNKILEDVSKEYLVKFCIKNNEGMSFLKEVGIVKQILDSEFEFSEGKKTTVRNVILDRANKYLNGKKQIKQEVLDRMTTKGFVKAYSHFKPYFEKALDSKDSLFELLNLIIISFFIGINDTTRGKINGFDESVYDVAGRLSEGIESSLKMISEDDVGELESNISRMLRRFNSVSSREGVTAESIVNSLKRQFEMYDPEYSIKSLRYYYSGDNDKLNEFNKSISDFEKFINENKESLRLTIDEKYEINILRNLAIFKQEFLEMRNKGFTNERIAEDLDFIKNREPLRVIRGYDVLLQHYIDNKSMEKAFELRDRYFDILKNFQTPSVSLEGEFKTSNRNRMFFIKNFYKEICN